jgi:glyoxylase-like metal-dependent hydrolase (beta-lactamase superfamily II)/ferredoxin
MADLRKIVPENVSGEFFVDTTCIDCDTCRQIAPEVFGETDTYSFVKHQPADEAQTRLALRALVCCPTGSIGTRGRNLAGAVMDDFPLLIEDDVYYSGFNSPKSYGGNSYFVRHRDGNWLIDSPKFLPRLVRRLEDLGGLSRIFLTHQDDVADAERYAAHFGAKRIIHREELDAQPEAEIVIDSFDDVPMGDFRVIPTPGHTRGHCVLLYRDRFLFTGDHLWWERSDKRLGASRSYCWYSWPEQTASMARLLDYRFEWVLPGHGQQVKLPAAEMNQKLRELVERMRKRS